MNIQCIYYSLINITVNVKCTQWEQFSSVSLEITDFRMKLCICFERIGEGFVSFSWKFLQTTYSYNLASCKKFLCDFCQEYLNETLVQCLRWRLIYCLALSRLSRISLIRYSSCIDRNQKCSCFVEDIRSANDLFSYLSRMHRTAQMKTIWPHQMRLM